MNYLFRKNSTVDTLHVLPIVAINNKLAPAATL